MALIVAVAIVRDQCVLAAQRSYPPDLAGWWEFPGGKVDGTETEQAAAARECQEELGVAVNVGGRLGPNVITATGHDLHLWSATLANGEPASGEPQAREHAALRWLQADELYDVRWSPVDLDLVPAVEALLRGTVTTEVRDPEVLP